MIWPQRSRGSSRKRPDVEAAVSAARWLLAMIAAALVIGDQPELGAAGLPRLLVLGSAIVMTPIAAHFVHRSLVRRGTSGVLTGVVLQTLDLIATESPFSRRLGPEPSHPGSRLRCWNHEL